MLVKTKIFVTEYVSWFNRTILTITCKNFSLRNLSRSTYVKTTSSDKALRREAKLPLMILYTRVEFF